MSDGYTGPPLEGFSDAEFVVGTAVALRSWYIGGDGTLRGWHSQQWRPGENHARCLPPTMAPKRPPHQVPHERCGCGFWAYFPGRIEARTIANSLLTVIGVVECYGNMLVGPLGVRSQKARIVGLTVPRVTYLTRDYTSLLPFRPHVTVYSSVDAMIRNHTFTEPPTELRLTPETRRLGWP